MTNQPKPETMKLEDQVVDLDLSKKIAELGVPQNSLFYWIKDFDFGQGWSLMGEGYFYGMNYDAGCFKMCDYYRERYELYSAFTASELGELLPTAIDGKSIFTDRFHDLWLVGYADIYEDDVPFMPNEVDARAMLLIHLLQNGLYKLPL